MGCSRCLCLAIRSCDESLWPRPGCLSSSKMETVIGQWLTNQGGSLQRYFISQPCQRGRRVVTTQSSIHWTTTLFRSTVAAAVGVGGCVQARSGPPFSSPKGRRKGVGICLRDTHSGPKTQSNMAFSASDWLLAAHFSQDGKVGRATGDWKGRTRREPGSPDKFACDIPSWLDLMDLRSAVVGKNNARGHFVGAFSFSREPAIVPHRVVHGSGCGPPLTLINAQTISETSSLDISVVYQSAARTASSRLWRNLTRYRTDMFKQKGEAGGDFVCNMGVWDESNGIGKSALAAFSCLLPREQLGLLGLFGRHEKLHQNSHRQRLSVDLRR